MRVRFVVTAVIAIVITATLAMPGFAIAHPGHPHKVMGTVTTLHENHLEVKATDGKTWAITLNDKTRILRGKTPVKAEDIKAGERVVVTALETKGKDGKATMSATEVRLAAANAAASR